MSWGCRKNVVWMLLALAALTIIIRARVVESCIEEERLALLDLNSYFRSHYDVKYAQYFKGLDYGAEDRYNCCAWQTVKCNPTTEHVIQLDLKSMHGALMMGEQTWIFNVTMLQPFTQLVSLDLSYNSIGGLVEKDGSTRLSTLKNLQSLVLNGDNFIVSNNESGRIFLSALTSLKTLSLIGWGLNETTLQGIEDLRELQELYLNNNYFGSSIFQKLANLRQLKVLDLSSNLVLSGSTSGLCELKNLLELHLRYNRIIGVLPSCLHNLSSLQVLDLSHGNLTGELPPNIFPNLTSLVHLDLSDNHFEGKLSLNSFANLLKLQYLDLSRSNLQVEIEDSSSWRPTFQLQYLGLQGCSLNNSKKGTIRKFLSRQQNLSTINLSDNNLVGSFPSWLSKNNSDTTNPLDTLIISGNNFHGNLPENIGLLFPQLSYLNVSGCQLEGSIPNSIAQMSQLYTLDMSFNNLSGELPRALLSNSTSLAELQLNDNNLQGEIIPDYMNLPVLFMLKLNNNRFGGTIKDALRESSALFFLDISNNKVTGSLPSWIANFSPRLDTLSVSNNSMQGQIPAEICNLEALSYLDLSHNNFNGSIPSCSNFGSLKYMFLNHNRFTGPIPSAFSSASNLLAFDLRDNQLSGNIPPWINKLSILQMLLLSGNTFHGQIPRELCRLQDIGILDLSRNNLSGRLPACFGNMSLGIKTNSAKYISSIYIVGDDSALNVAEEVDLLVKNQYRPYMGSVLELISVLDLSSNKFSGAIPPELGDLRHVHSLNLSHNYLSGSIPSSLSNMKEIESLDLSYNNLSGMIPIQLAELNFLGTFNVSYNNLTGRTPEAGQFGNFDKTSYLGNPGLCVSLLNKSCNTVSNNDPPPPTSTTTEEDGGGLDMEDFLWSFTVTSFIIFMATVAVLGINHRWREAFFDFVEWHLLWWLL